MARPSNTCFSIGTSGWPVRAARRAAALTLRLTGSISSMIEWPEVARAAEAYGYESVWIPEHLVFPATITGTPAAIAS